MQGHADGLAKEARLLVVDGSVEMTSRIPPGKVSWVLVLLGLLMTSHLTFLGFRSDEPNEFQRAAETYVTILLALMAPVPLK